MADSVFQPISRSVIDPETYPGTSLGRPAGLTPVEFVEAANLDPSRPGQSS